MNFFSDFNGLRGFRDKMRASKRAIYLSIVSKNIYLSYLLGFCLTLSLIITENTDAIIKMTIVLGAIIMSLIDIAED
jgi:hypothetical protein